MTAQGPIWHEMKPTLAPAPPLTMGLIALANDGTIEDDVRAFLPPDIRLCTTRIYSPPRNTLDSLAALQDRLADAAATLMPASHLDVLAFGCSSAAMALGPELVHATLARDRPGLPVTDPITAAIRKLDDLGCRRIALLTPYIGEVNAMVAAFLASRGLHLLATGYFPLVDDHARGRVTAEAFEAAARHLTADPAVEALLISCTALPTAAVIPRLEALIARPVVTSNQALCWDSLRLARRERLEPKLTQPGMVGRARG